MTDHDSTNDQGPLVNPWPYVGLGILLGIVAFVGAVFLLGDFSDGVGEVTGTPSPTSRVTALVRVSPTPTVVRLTPTPFPTSPSAPTPTAVQPTPTSTVLPTATFLPATPTLTPPAPPATPPLPTVTPLPEVPTNTPSAPGQPDPAAEWQATFFNNVKLEGVPAQRRQDEDINFVWGAASPANGVGADDFSVRWEQQRRFPAGSYRFYARSNDGVRVYVNNVLLIDDWRTGRPRLRSVSIGLQEGVYDLRVEHYTAAGSAEVQVWWRRADFDEWQGAYFDNPNLEGDPVLLRNDEELAFDWETFSPNEGDENELPADNFSAQWTRVVPFERGFYDFEVTVSDGVRLYVDGVPLIEAWSDGTKVGVSNEVWLHQGNHRLLVEYYERRERAEIFLSWSRTDLTINNWVGEYYDNPDLFGLPVLVQGEDSINFDWGLNAPAGGLPADQFSARWTRTFVFEPGIYRFTARADDGVRVYAGGQLVLDGWQQQLATTYEGVTVLRGEREVVVEYFDAQGPALVSLFYERIGPPPE